MPASAQLIIALAKINSITGWPAEKPAISVSAKWRRRRSAALKAQSARSAQPSKRRSKTAGENIMESGSAAYQAPKQCIIMPAFSSVA